MVLKLSEQLLTISLPLFSKGTFSAANGTSATKVKDNRLLPTKIRQTQLLVTYIFVPFLKKVIKGIVSVTKCLDTLTLRLGFNLITDK